MIALVDCGPDEVVTGGGFDYDDDSNVVNPDFDSFPIVAEWGVGTMNPGPDTTSISAWAQCAKLVGVP